MAEKKIGGRLFKVDPLLATEAVRLQLRLTKTLQSGLDQLPTIFRGAGDKATPEAKEQANAAAAKALSGIVAGLDPDEGTDLIKTVVEIAHIQAPSKEWRQVDFDGDFTGNLKDMLPVAAFVLREQFSELFSAALATGLRAKTTGAH